jgi:hypothetical protein
MLAFKGERGLQENGNAGREGSEEEEEEGSTELSPETQAFSY